MSTKKKNWILNTAAVLLLIPAFFLAIVLQGLFFCRTTDPFEISSLEQRYPEYAGSTIRHHIQVEDSALVLLEKPGGQVLLLEFQKNLLLHRYQLQEVDWIGREDSRYQAAARTPHAVYPFLIDDHETILLHGTVDCSLQWNLFLCTYGPIAFLLYAAALLGCKGLSLYIARRKQHNGQNSQ